MSDSFRSRAARPAPPSTAQRPNPTVERARPQVHRDPSSSPASRTDPAAAATVSPAWQTADPLTASTVAAKGQSSLQMKEAVATAGKGGEHDLSVWWVDVWIGNAKPCRFDVTTLTDHALEVVVEQAAYRRVYNGTGTLSTLPVPVAPLGTTLSVRATDTTTGETVQQEGVWRDMSGGGSSLWQFLKRLFWKG